MSPTQCLCIRKRSKRSQVCIRRYTHTQHQRRQCDFDLSIFVICFFASVTSISAVKVKAGYKKEKEERYMILYFFCLPTIGACVWCSVNEFA